MTSALHSFTCRLGSLDVYRQYPICLSRHSGLVRSAERHVIAGKIKHLKGHSLSLGCNCGGDVLSANQRGQYASFVKRMGRATQTGSCAQQGAPVTDRQVADLDLPADELARQQALCGNFSESRGSVESEPTSSSVTDETLQVEESGSEGATPGAREGAVSQQEVQGEVAVPAAESAAPLSDTGLESKSISSSGEAEGETTASSRTEGEEGETAEEDEELEVEAGYKMKSVCDKLVEVFWIDRPKPEEWRKLLAYSEEWTKIRPHFFKRCRARAKAMDDPSKRAELFKLGRRLKEVDDEMQAHNELLEKVEAADPAELDSLILRRRNDFTGSFFEHLRLLMATKHDNPERADELASVAARCVAALEVHDKVMEDEAALDSAQQKFSDILNSPSLEVACRKIDELASQRKLDSTLMLLITKAWAAAKESTMMKDEVKDIMYHLYMGARGNMQRLVPKEVRILKHVMSMDDPRERFAALTEAFSPGEELEGQTIDTLYTTPESLHKWIKHTLDAYYSNREGTLIKEAQQLMNPRIIKRLEIIKEAIEDEFL